MEQANRLARGPPRPLRTEESPTFRQRSTAVSIDDGVEVEFSFARKADIRFRCGTRDQVWVHILKLGTEDDDTRSFAIPVQDLGVCRLYLLRQSIFDIEIDALGVRIGGI